MRRKIRLSETDATGIIYFTNQLKFATEAFESFLEERLGPFRTHPKEYLLPIVEARSQYYLPLHLGDEIEIALKLAHIGRKSLKVETLIYKEGKKTGETLITHILVSKATGKSIPIPEEIKAVVF